MSQFKHIVLLRFAPHTPREEIATIFEALDELEKMPGVVEISGGPYESDEGLHKGFTHAFVVTFADVESRDGYFQSPEHEHVKQLILNQLPGGLADLIAFDFAVNDRFRY